MRHRVRHVHFVGIGGAGMSGIAEVLAGLGYTVSGSDLVAGEAVARLRSLGIRVDIGHAAENAAGADTVVVSSAVSPDNPEVLAARAARVPVVPRAMMLGDLMRLKQGIGIAGTHGKTTTTSLVAAVLAEAGLDPTFVIGGRLNAAGANARLGRGEYLVAEADESDAHFLELQPVVGVVTNIDADHMETYGHDHGRLLEAFASFLNRLPFYGLAVACADDANVRAILPRVARPTLTYGMAPEAQLCASEVRWDGGHMRFLARQEGCAPLEVSLNLAGEHNVRNALAAIAVARHVGAGDAAIAAALARFQGVGRRFEQHGDVTLPDGRRFTLVDDYGHHPAEMTATLAAARMAFPGRRLLLAFQPHRYTRTRDLFEDFVRVLSTVDALVLADVYPASEAPIVAADGRALARAVRVVGRVEPVFAEAVTEARDAVLETVRDGDLVLVMGAGTIGALPAMLLAAGRPALAVVQGGGA